MNLTETVKRVKEEIQKGKKEAITNNCYFLKDGVLSLRNDLGDARHPYVVDGLTLWTHQNGKVSLNEGDFFLLPESLDGESSHLSFFLGKKNKKGYEPTSLFEFDHALNEKKVKRYTIFFDTYTLYLLEKDDLIYSMRIGLDMDKSLLVELSLINEGKESQEVYSSSFFDFHMMHGNYGSVETKWFRKTEYCKDLFTLSTVEDMSRYEHLHHKAYLKRKVSSKAIEENTTSRGIYCHSRTGRVESSECLLTGSFDKEKNVTCFGDTAICGDILKFNLKPKESAEISYVFKREEKPENFVVSHHFETNEKKKEDYYASNNFLHMDFEGNEESKVFSEFMKNVVKQVEYCALSKNSSLRMLGIRDAFQAIEGGVLFDPEEMRKMILRSLDYTGINGRMPRQYSYCEPDVTSIPLDTRNFIDQGLWVMDCLYTYLSYTGDTSILKESCGYLKIEDGKPGERLPLKEDVLSHLYRITQYLTNNIDSDTHCLKTLYGDWNDAIDGLGKGENPNGFGNGVSIMATFQLYQDLEKMKEIALLCSDEKKAKEFLGYRKEIEQGLLQYAFVKKGNETKVIHGWGDKRKYLVGSFSDIDEKSRDTLTSNAFYVISGFSKEHPEYIPGVKKALKRLDSKYGFKTFEPYFSEECREVGRIVNLPKGTAENAATYIHATVFGIKACLEMKEPKLAFEEIHKILPFTHSFVTTTPFVMPNSYLDNPAIDVDGESMNDWYTGSSNTLLKTLVKDVFGISPTLEELVLNPVDYLPFNKASLSLPFMGRILTITLSHSTEKTGKIYLNGKELPHTKGTEIHLKKKDLPKELHFEVYLG